MDEGAGGMDQGTVVVLMNRVHLNVLMLHHVDDTHDVLHVSLLVVCFDDSAVEL